MGSDSTSLVAELTSQMVARVANCYAKHDLCCSESIVYVLSQAFASELSGREAVRLGAGYCHGMGGAGCSCGALTGAVAMLSFYLSPHTVGGLKKKAFRALIKQMHDEFKDRFRTTCCRVLCKKVKQGERYERRVSCQELTEGGAEIATRILLAARPRLAEAVDRSFLASRSLALDD